MKFKLNEEVKVIKLTSSLAAQMLGIREGFTGYIKSFQYGVYSVYIYELEDVFGFYENELESLHKDEDKAIQDGGGSRNYYDLPEGAKQLQDLIEYRNMNGNLKDIFKACYRMGLKEGTSDEYDARKIVYYGLRELGRQLGRKDFINLAKEVIGHQDEGSN